MPVLRKRRGEAQLTRTYPSRTVYTRQPSTPAGLERNHRGQAEPAAAAEAAEQGNTERPASTSDNSATNNEPPRTAHRTGRP